MSATFASHLMTFIGYTSSSAATPFYEELARLTGDQYLKIDEFECIMTIMECAMHKGRSVEPLKVRNIITIKLVYTSQLLTATVKEVASNLLCSIETTKYLNHNAGPTQIVVASCLAMIDSLK